MDWVEKYIDLPFLNRGRDRSGVDCWGLCRLVYEEQLGLNFPSYCNMYTQSIACDSVNDAFTEGKLGGWAEVTTPIPFDLIIFTLCGRPFHCGIIVSSDYMLHIMSGCNAAVEKFTTRLWGRRIDGIYRFKK